MDRPRAWSDPEGSSSTIVLYDREKVFMHTNLGWLQVETEEAAGPLSAAEGLAKSYGLTEVSAERARWLSGAEEEEEYE